MVVSCLLFVVGGGKASFMMINEGNLMSTISLLVCMVALVLICCLLWLVVLLTDKLNSLGEMERSGDKD